MGNVQRYIPFRCCLWMQHCMYSNATRLCVWFKYCTVATFSTWPVAQNKTAVVVNGLQLVCPIYPYEA
jgi:hypothetical protein